ncbi:enoyl-CoA hydratase/isomerase family protein [Roseomonas sp. SSH11]|uniref:Enoyl-CoA hydratase/isomerase family protein n=1 Tax=Pararoseomonas baculiformis TaxID=2820812 RepID=A0ABS4AC68_9PROT|nr:enoyl-CoA hydratase/isomerase family protein [Pararoseomonas baculiformis]MBP0443844.1 enoyl-CoA hydratase/isomerase family protein [Pararoseomonas baculiformis]
MTPDEPVSDAILLEADGPVAVLTLNRPKARNAIDDAMRADLMAALDHVARTDSIKALVVTGAGQGFCAGGDVKSMQARLSVPQNEVALNGWRRQQRTHHAISMLHALPKPTIAAVNGAATGLGCDVALCCDFVIASDAARFAMTYILRGLIPDGGGMYFLPRRVGLSRAKEFIFTGRTVEPEEALRLGMIDRVTTTEALLGDARAWAAELGRGAPAALALSKTILDQTFELSVEQVFAMGSQAQAICYSSKEHQESVAAFLEGVAQRRAAKAKGDVA